VQQLSRELIAICRVFGFFEREAICGGLVTVPQCLVLQSLLDAPRDIASLASLSRVTSSGMTRLVDGLEKHGWIERRRAEEDRRRIEVTLTSAGRRLAERLSIQTDATLTAVLSHVPEEKHESVLEALRLLRQALESSRDAIGACCDRMD
jgi:DNA-binding MarR family transcriptional regulator